MYRSNFRLHCSSCKIRSRSRRVSLDCKPFIDPSFVQFFIQSGGFRLFLPERVQLFHLFAAFAVGSFLFPVDFFFAGRTVFEGIKCGIAQFFPAAEILPTALTVLDILCFKVQHAASSPEYKRFRQPLPCSFCPRFVCRFVLPVPVIAANRLAGK